MILLIIPLLFILSCSVKVERECDIRSEAYTPYRLNHVPKEFRIYGRLVYGPMKFPLMIAKFDGFYTVRVAKVRDLSLKKDRICARGKCYLLPLLPEELIFGRVLTGQEFAFCREGKTIFRERLGVYEKLVFFEGPFLRELIIVNRKTRRGLKITFGEKTGKGYYGELSFEMNGEKVKLEIEEVET
jgi:hypothetical protein